MNKPLDKSYWENRYKENQTGWDIGYASTPLKEYIDQLNNKEIKVLVPGCGNAYEAEYMHTQGFKNVVIIDLAEQAIKNFKNRVPNFPEKKILQEDFFKHSETYDLILEQTFFCALLPELREAYVIKMHSLLKDKGKLAGVLFNCDFPNGNPPFGGKEEEYKKYFKPYFTFNTFETAYNSVNPRQGSELFINLSKKKI